MSAKPTEGGGRVPRSFASLQKGQRHDWMAFKVPEEFSDVFWAQSGRARDVPRAIARNLRTLLALLKADTHKH